MLKQTQTSAKTTRLRIVKSEGACQIAPGKPLFLDKLPVARNFEAATGFFKFHRGQ